jgi:hypothetical protein
MYIDVQFDCQSYLNLIKMTYLTCSSLLICRGMGDMKKPHYDNNMQSTSSIFNDAINTGYDLLLVANKMFKFF